MYIYASYKLIDEYNIHKTLGTITFHNISTVISVSNETMLQWRHHLSSGETSIEQAQTLLYIYLYMYVHVYILFHIIRYVTSYMKRCFSHSLLHVSGHGKFHNFFRNVDVVNFSLGHFDFLLERPFTMQMVAVVGIQQRLGLSTFKLKLVFLLAQIFLTSLDKMLLVPQKCRKMTCVVRVFPNHRVAASR